MFFSDSVLFYSHSRILLTIVSKFDNDDVSLQGVRRHQAGNYTCIGSNLEGDQESNTVRLRILCE